MVESKFNIQAIIVKSKLLFQRDRLPFVGEFIATQAKYLCSVGKYNDGRVGGRLRGSITWATSEQQSDAEAPASSADKIQKPTQELTLRIGTNVEYAAPQEFGAAAHFIVPKRENGVLVFTIGGKKVFAKYVEHPGNAAQPFLRPSVDLYKQEILQLLGGKKIINE